MMKPDSENFTGNDRFEGYCVDLTKRLAEMLNISYELRLVKDGGFGSQGSISSLLGSIVVTRIAF